MATVSSFGISVGSFHSVIELKCNFIRWFIFVRKIHCLVRKRASCSKRVDTLVELARCLCNEKCRKKLHFEIL